MTTRADVVAEARTWLGTRFHHQARTKGVGCDCAGLWIGVGRALNLVEPDFDVTGYERQPNGLSLIRWCDKYMAKRYSKSDMRPGMGVAVIYDQQPGHLGIVVDYPLGGLGMIHAALNNKAVVECRLEFTPGMRFFAAYDFPGVV